jgi:hypothetical protein
LKNNQKKSKNQSRPCRAGALKDEALRSRFAADAMQAVTPQQIGNLS